MSALYLVVLPSVIIVAVFAFLWKRLSPYKYGSFPSAIAKGFRASRYVLTRGQQDGDTDFYYDIDLSITDHKSVKPIVDWYLDALHQIDKRIDLLGFIEKYSGPVGALPLMGAIVMQSKISAIIIRLQRRLEVINAIKGPSIENGSNVVLISDVMTSGSGIKKAIDRVNLFGGNVIAAVVAINRMDPEDVKKFEDEFNIKLFFSKVLLEKSDALKEPLRSYIDAELNKSRSAA